MSHLSLLDNCLQSGHRPGVQYSMRALRGGGGGGKKKVKVNELVGRGRAETNSTDFKT